MYFYISYVLALAFNGPLPCFLSPTVLPSVVGFPVVGASSVTFASPVPVDLPPKASAGSSVALPAPSEGSLPTSLPSVVGLPVDVSSPSATVSESSALSRETPSSGSNSPSSSASRSSVGAS